MCSLPPTAGNLGVVKFTPTSCWGLLDVASLNACCMYDVYILVRTQIRGFFGSRYKLFPPRMLVKFSGVIVKFLGRLVLINLLPFWDTSTLSSYHAPLNDQCCFHHLCIYISKIHSYHGWRCMCVSVIHLFLNIYVEKKQFADLLHMNCGFVCWCYLSNSHAQVE